MSTKDFSEVSRINCVSTLQEINISLLQNGKPAKFCRQNHMNIHVLASSENNQSFYSIVDFFVCFTTLSERNVPGKIQRFVAPDRSEMIHFKIGDPESRNGGTVERWKITPNPKRRNGGKSPQINYNPNPYPFRVLGFGVIFRRSAAPPSLLLGSPLQDSAAVYDVPPFPPRVVCYSFSRCWKVKFGGD